MRLESGREVIELASGVDALYLSGVATLPSDLADGLTRARDLARQGAGVAPLELGSVEFLVGAYGVHRYAFRLDHEHGMVLLTPSAALPAVRVQPRAAFLHAVGTRQAIAWFSELLGGVLGSVVWTASRVDLFMDSHGWTLRAEDRARFTCRASQRVTYEDQDVLTGLRFGGGKSGAVMARIYDKSEEIRIKGTDWWPQVWGEAYRPEERVLRVEFQVGRDVLREMGLRDPIDVLDEVGSIWAYLTEEWLKFQDPTADGTRSRWPVASEWCQVQTASLRGEAIGIDRVLAGQAAGSMRHLLPGLRGYLASVGALLGCQTLDETLHRVGRVLQLDEDQSGVAFAGRLAEKRRGLRIA